MTSTEAGAIVLGADYRALGVVRSLGRRGIRVWVLADKDRLATFSRYASRSMSWPAAAPQRRRFLMDLAVRYALDGWVLFPTADSTAALLEQHHEELAASYLLPTAPWDSMRWAQDKRLTSRLASTEGIDQPWTACPLNRDEVAAAECPFPAILKPAFKMHASNRFTDDKAWRVNDRSELLQRYDEASTLVDPAEILIQELIPGGDGSLFAYSALCRDGQVLASMVTRSVRQYPPDFGHFSTFVETIAEPRVEHSGRRVLQAIHADGVAQVQFKRDPRDGRYKLLDINMRIWGSHAIAQAAGVDFPYLLWRFARRESIPETRARPGVHWARLSADLIAAARLIGKGSLSLHDYLQSVQPPLAHAIFAADDPLPAVFEVPLLVQRAAKGTVAI